MTNMKTYLISMLCFCSMGTMAQTSVTKATLEALNGTKTQNEVSVHDPSIVYNESDKYYYLVGSHMGLAKSKDLVDWTSIDNGKWVIMPNWWENYQDGSYLYNKTFWEAFKSNPSHEVTLADGSTATLGSYDAGAFCSIYANNDSAWIKGDMWAPDVIYNKAMGKWCYYLSLNGDNWASVIILMTGSSPVGPFKYEAPIVFGGFNNRSYGGKKVDYKNTDLELVLGNLSSLPARYNVSANWGNYYPNCIDPCVFYDEDGELWMIYGSWSGGIYSLKLDKNTGLRDYTVKYSGTGTSPNTGDDAYFGKKIAGGKYSSGEGSYIRHIGDYYYLFMSYGFFDPNGGYEMRVFRSTSPTGPFVDANGQAALHGDTYYMNYGPKATTNRGIKLIGAYNEWGNMTVGECAQGHNSAIVGADGEAYLVCHTKFHDGTAGHQVRIYRMYVNDQGWLVTSPFRYTGSTNSVAGINTTTQKEIETTQPFSAEQIAGDYHLMIHPYKLDYTRMQESLEMPITLTADGKITGEKTGTWEYTQEGKSYIKLVIGGVTYYGVVCQQGINGGCKNAISITSVAKSGVPAWLYKQEPQSAIASYYAKFIDYAGQPTASNISVTKSAPETTENITLEYTSKNTDVIANDGTIYPQTEDTKVGITPVYINCGDFVYKYTSFATKNLNVKAGDAENGAVAFYPLDALDNTNLYDATQKMTAYKSGTATMPRIDEDSERGNVLHQFKTADINNCSYVRMPNPLYNSSAEEFTVNFWVKPISPRSIWGAYFSFFEGTTPTASGGRFYITDNSYIGYNGSAGWFDINKPDTVTYYDIPMGKWSMVTMTASSSGVTFYVNGYPHTAKLWNSGTGGTEEQFNYTGMLSDINTYPYMYLGAGSWWGSAGCYLSDLKVFDRSLSESDVQALRLAQPAYIRGDVNGDGVVNGTDIQAVINFIVIGEYDEKADVNEDGKVNGTDIQEIINIIVNAE